MARVQIIAYVLQDGNERKRLGTNQIGRVTNEPQPEKMLGHAVSHANRIGYDEMSIAIL